MYLLHRGYPWKTRGCAYYTEDTLGGPEDVPTTQRTPLEDQRMCPLNRGHTRRTIGGAY